jgi:hypothetical protein
LNPEKRIRNINTRVMALQMEGRKAKQLPGAILPWMTKEDSLVCQQ